MRRRATGTGLFLLELLVVILFFSVSAAICLRVFATARRASIRSNDLSLAVVHAESAAECFKAAHGDLDETADLLHAEPTSAGLAAFYDKTWTRCGVDAAVFTLTLAADGCEAHIAVSDGTEEYFALDAVALADTDEEAAE